MLLLLMVTKKQLNDHLAELQIVLVLRFAGTKGVEENEDKDPLNATRKGFIWVLCFSALQP